MLISTTENIPNKKVCEILGIARGSTVRARNIGKDILASFKSLIGGEITSYTDMMDEARIIATERLLKDAEALGADAVIGFKLQTSAVMGGAAEIIAYGTAVKLD